MDILKKKKEVDIFGGWGSTYYLWILCMMQSVKPSKTHKLGLLNSHWQIVWPLAVVCDQSGYNPVRQCFVLQVIGRGNPKQKKPGFVVVSFYN